MGKVISIVILFFLVLSCGPDRVQVPVKKVENKIEQKIKENNLEKSRAIANYENRAIDTLIQIKGWSMNTSKTGLRWNIVHDQNCTGQFPKKGDYLDLEIEVLDIHEKVIFKKQNQVIRFRKEVIENGLDEALSKMCIGSKAKLILPSHLAFGLRGYKNDIGLNQVLIYNVEFINKK